LIEGLATHFWGKIGNLIWFTISQKVFRKVDRIKTIFGVDSILFQGSLLSAK